MTFFVISQNIITSPALFIQWWNLASGKFTTWKTGLKLEKKVRKPLNTFKEIKCNAPKDLTFGVSHVIDKKKIYPMVERLTIHQLCQKIRIFWPVDMFHLHSTRKLQISSVVKTCLNIAHMHFEVRFRYKKRTIFLLKMSIIVWL